MRTTVTVENETSENVLRQLQEWDHWPTNVTETDWRTHLEFEVSDEDEEHNLHSLVEVLEQETKDGRSLLN